MAMVRIEVDVPASAFAALERAAYALGVQGLEILDADTGHPQGRAGVRLFLPAGREARDAAKALARALPAARIVVTRAAAARDAAASSRRSRARDAAPSRRAVKLGKRFVVVDPGGVSREGRRGDARVVLCVDPRAAFGDGLHPTTRLVVDAMERQADAATPAKRGRGPAHTGRSVLDVGTGTGVLGMVALSLGASALVATDVDALARDAARGALRAHRAANALEAPCRVQKPLPRRTFDWVVANLYRDVLLALAPRLAARVAPAGILVASGFGPGSRREVLAAFEAAGLVRRDLRRRSGWCAVVYVRPA